MIEHIQIFNAIENLKITSFVCVLSVALLDSIFVNLNK